MAAEPTHSPRSLTYQIFDDQFPSNTITATISITLVNDNVLMLSCGVGVATFVEGSHVPLHVANGVTVVDMDADHMITRANVTLLNPQVGDVIAVDVGRAGGLSVNSEQGSEVIVSGAGTDEEYQVREGGREEGGREEGRGREEGGRVLREEGGREGGRREGGC